MTLFMQALEDAEKQREQNWPLERQNKGRMSTAMRQSFEDGTFWFEQILRSVHTCSDEFYWPHLKPSLEERRLLNIGVPDEEEIEQFVARKMEDLEAYNKELKEKKNNNQQTGSEMESRIQETDHVNDDTAVAEPEDIQHEEAEIHLTSQSRDQAYTSTFDRADSEAASQDPPRTNAIADTRCIEQAGTSADDHVDDIAADSAG
ncbi:unnamed protein product [Aureobasidium mustum]|uniref:Uncharacterized protein n=1 Tax=Aureobasidium mustum TaxID=2773714 RepID=A0A9N8K9G9_9PEZI|nr:unnamed protein product [Aureobasidium mustum]